MKAVLTKPERTQLKEFEEVLNTARRWAVEEAKALKSIRDRRLYRITHATFEAYGQERWGYDRPHLYRLCAWAETLENLSPIGGAAPKRESHARPLYGLPPERQRQLWGEVQRRLGGSVTAEAVQEIVVTALAKRSPAQRTPIGLTGDVVHGDAVERVRDLKTGTVDLALFSPPYCEQRKQYPGVREADYPEWIVSLLDSMEVAMKPTANVLIVAREHLRDGQISDVWLRTRLAVRAAGWIECETLFWHAEDRPPLGRPDRPRRTIEYVFWFSKTKTPFVDLRACGTPIDQKNARLARPRAKNIRGLQSLSRYREQDTARVTDVISVTTGSNAVGADHPAQFPFSLADQLVRTYSPEGGLVIDPTCGSGTTLLAARDAGRRWWGCDVVGKYVDLSRNRLSK